MSLAQFHRQFGYSFNQGRLWLTHVTARRAGFKKGFYKAGSMFEVGS
jgi:hypothetical protein